VSITSQLSARESARVHHAPDGTPLFAPRGELLMESDGATT